MAPVEDFSATRLDSVRTFEPEIDTDLRPLTRAPDVPFMTVHDRINRAAIGCPKTFYRKTATCLYPC